MIGLVARTQQAEGRAAVKRLCGTLSIGRSSYYRGRRDRPDPEGMVHHSDRGGVQYASKAYVDALENAGIHISMSRRGNPYDNAQAERFIRTLKYEEVYLYEYASLEEARSRIGYFIDKRYNRKRLHSALDYRPPAEFEQMVARVKTVA